MSGTSLIVVVCTWPCESISRGHLWADIAARFYTSEVKNTIFQTTTVRRSREGYLEININHYRCKYYKCSHWTSVTQNSVYLLAYVYQILISVEDCDL